MSNNEPRNSIGYESLWEFLCDAVARVMALTGASEADVRGAFCKALLDGAIEFRAGLKKPATSGMTSKAILKGSAFELPRTIEPEDIDWEKSRPKKPWVVARGAYSVPGYWHLDWIEVAKADVTQRLCGGAQKQLRQTKSNRRLESIEPATVRSGPRSKKFDATKAAMKKEIIEGALTVAALQDMLQKELAARFSVSRGTAVKARAAVLSDLSVTNTGK